MPIYVYECSNCKDVYEVEQRIVEDALTDCRCGSIGTLKRVIQPVGVLFKGSGFHINDYSGTSGKEVSEAKSSDSPASPSSEAAPAESKPTAAAAETSSPPPATESK